MTSQKLPLEEITKVTAVQLGEIPILQQAGLKQ